MSYGRSLTGRYASHTIRVLVGVWSEHTSIVQYSRIDPEEYSIMHLRRHPVVLFAAVALAFVFGAIPAVVQTSSAEASTKVSAIKLLKLLPVKKESHSSSYERADFKLWVDANADCQDSRAEVLVSESKKATTAKAGSCTIATGKWVSSYDGKKITAASKLDIDHMVPLAEAWRSGAWKWTAEKREAYANDLGYAKSLIAVSASSNRSKGDSDVAEWLPKKNRCDYVESWVAVKFRWKLQIDKAEKKAALHVLNACDSVMIAKPGKLDIKTLVPVAVVTPPVVTPPVVTPPVVTPPVVTPPVTTPPVVTPPVVTPPVVPPVVTPTTPASGTDPQYATCAAAKAAHAHTPYYLGIDPEYAWYRDSDSDGIVCE